SIYLDSGKIDPRITPKAENINFQLRAPCKNISIPILEADKIVDLPEFDVNGQVVIYISGWRTTINGTTETQDMANAFNCRGGYNFLYVDPLNYVQTIYTWSAFNTEAVGAFVAEGIVKLVKKIPLKNIYLIGHSLGAQMVGKAGRQFTNLTGQYIPRITGLDPANPCFNEGEVLSGILRGDADFVDIIHTNPGVLGKKEPRGNVDFYVEGYGPIKPRCTKFGCSHKRAVKYYTESVYPGHESDFLAKRCNSLISLNTGRCDGPEYPMGFATPSNLNGKFFLNVNGVPPYGKNATTGIESNACGLCTK
uniref:Lipase domain-containing protein n=1 Tax=Stomoxys calcitrans TaxID=35570 RepID=A0A1I8Q014_STOCA